MRPLSGLVVVYSFIERVRISFSATVLQHYYYLMINDSY
jgi:hypothetical protein